jgi:hypothetical protein
VRAGAAVFDITPPLGVPLSGSFTPRPAVGVDDPLYARAVVLEDERGAAGRVAIVCCDVIAIGGDTVRAARDLAGRWAGVPRERILIAATHTHSGPSTTGIHGTPLAESYVTRLPEGIAAAVAMAAARLRPARAAWGNGEEGRVSFNRRFRMRDGTVRMNPGRLNPEVVQAAGPIDPHLAVLWIEGFDATPIASLASFALHYIGTDDGGHVSADYFGHYARWMQRIYGPDLVPLLFNAASGDINGVDVTGRQSGGGQSGGGHSKARQVAGIIAGETLRVVERLQPAEKVTLGALQRPFSYQRKTITAQDLLVSERLLALPETVPPAQLRERAGLGDAGPFSWTVGQPIPDNVLLSYARECRLLAALPEQATTELQALRVGDGAIAALPGEIFVELGLALKGSSPFGGEAGATMVVGLANDYVGYVATRRAIAEEGSYETWAARSALPAAGEGERMIAAAGALLTDLRSS